MGGCYKAELKLQDQRLNAAYGRAMAARDAAGKTRLRAEERAWIARRDAGCAEGATGGTIDRVGIPGCLLDETISRRLVLEAMDCFDSRESVLQLLARMVELELLPPFMGGLRPLP